MKTDKQRLRKPAAPVVPTSLEDMRALLATAPAVIREAEPAAPVDALTDEDKRDILDALPKVGEPEELWVMVRGSTLRRLVAQQELA